MAARSTVGAANIVGAERRRTTAAMRSLMRPSIARGDLASILTPSDVRISGGIERSAIDGQRGGITGDPDIFRFAVASGFGFQQGQRGITGDPDVFRFAVASGLTDV